MVDVQNARARTAGKVPVASRVREAGPVAAHEHA
jgi:hypothetical protein